MDYPKPLLDNLNCTCRRLPACQQQSGAARKQHSRGPEPQRDALTRPISQERAAIKLCLFRRCGGQLRPVGLSQLFLECGRNPSEVLIKIRPQEAILRLPLVQVVIFRIICHIRPISSRHRKIPCVRHTAEREGFVLPDGPRAGVGTRPYIQAPQDTPSKTDPRKCRGGLYGRPRAGTSPAPTDKRHKTPHQKRTPENVGAAFMAARGRGQAPPLQISATRHPIKNGPPKM